MKGLKRYIILFLVVFVVNTVVMSLINKSLNVIEPLISGVVCIAVVYAIDKIRKR